MLFVLGSSSFQHLLHSIAVLQHHQAAASP